GAAYRLFEGTFFVTAAFGNAVFPVFSRLGRDGGGPLARAYELSCKAILAALAPVGVGLALFSSTIVVAVFGGGFSGASAAARWLGIAIPLYGLFAVSALVLTAVERQKVIAWVVGSITAENIALNLAFIPLWSLNGAAIAMAVTQATLTVVMMVMAHREVGH